MSVLLIHTAEDEDPDCNECDHACDNFDCNGSCRPEHGWYGYSRAERVKYNE